MWQPVLSSDLAMIDAELVASVCGDLLFAMLDKADLDHGSMPAWSDEQPAADRLAVWSAVGMLMAAGDLDDSTALALLRAFAYSHDLDLDLLATRLLERQLPLHTVLT